MEVNCARARVLENGRLIISLPFTRTAAVEELLVRCCLPRAREYCRQHGWSLLALCIADEVDPDLHNARPDTLRLCCLELDRCLRLSGGPGMLCVLDRTTQLVGPLPPASLPAAEYDKFLDYFHKITFTSTHTSPTPAALDGQPGTHLLRRWYRQTRNTASGKPDGDYSLVTPPELALPQDSIFAPDASAHHVPQCHRTKLASQELAHLGALLSSAALPALYPAKISPLSALPPSQQPPATPGKRCVCSCDCLE